MTTGYRILPVMALLLSAGACPSHASQLRTAQDSFSLAAEIENEIRLNGQLPRDPHLYYKEAFQASDKLIRSKEEFLKADDLYGTALTLRALSAWRLGELSRAREDARTVTRIAAEPSSPSRVWPRDHALCVALPLLIEIDQLGLAVGELPDDNSFDSVEQSILMPSRRIRSQLQGASNLVSAGHPLRVYLVSAELQLALTYGEAVGKITGDTGTSIQTYKTFKKEALLRLRGLAGEPALVDSREQILNLVKHYEEALP